MANTNMKKKKYTVPAKSTLTVDFDGMLANYWRVVNSGTTTLYGAVSSMPTASFYDFKIAGGTARTYGEKNPVSRIYLYNDGTADIDIIFTAYDYDFTPVVNALADLLGEDGDTAVTKVEIGGFTEALPKGNNNIGSVNINADDLKKIISGGVEKVTKITVNTDASEQYISAPSGFDYISEIDYMSNDGDEVIWFTLRNVDDTSNSAEIKINPNEVINNVKGKFGLIEIMGDGSTPMRLVYTCVKEY